MRNKKLENDYELFLANNAVINIKNSDEFVEFINLMRKLGLNKVNYMESIYDRYGFDNGFCFDGGIRYCQPSDVCFEYQLGKGFTFLNKQQYLSNDDIKICRLSDIINATTDGIRIDNIILEKPNKRKVYAYMRFNTDEKIKDYFGISEYDEKVKKIEDYEPIYGFYDLRDFEIPEKDFQDLWKLQLYLNNYQENKNIHSLAFPELWSLLKETATEYQTKLLSYPQKAKDNIEEEIER